MSLNIKISKNFIYLSITVLFVFLLSIVLLEHNISGDQGKYRAFYNSISGVSLLESYKIYTLNIMTLEPVYFLISFIVSNFGVPKDIYIAIVNSLLVIISFNVAKKYHFSPIVIFVILITNFYFFALYTELERLKFGILFFLISMLAYDNKKFFYILAILAIFTHVQVFLLYFSIFSVYAFSQLKKLISTYKINLKFLLFFIGIMFFILIMQEHLSRKLLYYFDGFDYLSFVKILPFLFLALLYGKNKSEVLAVFFPLLIAVLIVGGERLNIFGYFLFLYYGLQYRKGMNMGILITTIYFAIKSIDFVKNIFEFGSGY